MLHVEFHRGLKMTKRMIILIVALGLLSTELCARIPMIFLRGKQHLEDGRYSEALLVFEQSLKDPLVDERDELTIRREMANAYIGLRDWQSAERELRAVLKGARDERQKAIIEELIAIVSAPEDPSVRKINLGPAVNSQYDELAPVISPDGRTLFFIVDGQPEGFGRQDIFFSTKTERGDWTTAQNIGRPLNTEWHDGILSISPSGTSALVAGVYNRDGTKSSGFSVAQMAGGTWRFPEPLNIENYYNKNRLTSASMSQCGKFLLMALEREGGYGDLDIYVSRAIPDGRNRWSAPMNLGSDINTRGADGTPFLASDGKTLYFSSNGRVGLGSHDMYKSVRLDDSWKNWSKPVNLGKQINTPGWDAYYTIPAQGDVAYFVSSEAGGYGGSDIWMVTLPHTARPGAVVTVSGRVMEPDSTPVGATISWEKLATGANVGSVLSDDITGWYMIVLPVGEAFGYVAEKSGYLPSSAHLDLSQVEAFGEVHHDIFITPIARGAQTILKNVFFDFDKATLRPESIGELNRVRAFLEDNPSFIVEIAGHTDSIGTVDYNLRLSRDRANAVAEWLIENGIDERRLTVVGYGKSHPIADNATEEGRQENRRVIFKIIDM
ncbi:MAG TPA: OmpA family protein [candidate division Zixibacteria bacterium]|nr:OmpA family protein [candidate division Zixibacteria bacterium]